MQADDSFVWDDIEQSDDMAAFVPPIHSKREIVEAGKALAGTVDYDQEALRIFRIAHNWREAFAFPMHRMRTELGGKVRRDGGVGLTAARLKRMQSVRRKLKIGRLTLYQMQDIGGCRAILLNLANVNRVLGYYIDGTSTHTVHKINDYVVNPKSDGYRSHHVVMKFHGSGPNVVFNR